jgi:integrase
MNIVNTMLWMKKNAYEETTIRKVAKLLRNLQRNCNTKDPETVKLYIAKKTTSNGHKENLVEAYAIHLRSQNMTWEQPFYQRYDKKRRPPKEELIDFLINHARLEMALKLSMTKDLGERPIELTWLTLKDIELSTGIVSITGAKHTVGREGKLKNKTLDLLRIYIKKKKLNPTSRLFNMNSTSFSNNYRHTRNRIAEDYDMPELKQIQLYDFRRFKASKAYHLSGKLLLVKQLLGHKDTRSTERYISLFDEQNITWIPVVAETDEQIKQAIQNDCILVCQANAKTYFKKPA